MKERENNFDTNLILKPVGTVHSNYESMNDAPFQGRFAAEEAVLEIKKEYEEGLKDIETNKRLIVLYWADKAKRETLRTRTPWGPEVRGVFSCRSPSRPNPISICVVELIGRDSNRLTVKGLDAVDGSPVLDIKPYSAKIDSVPDAKIGWFKEEFEHSGENRPEGGEWNTR